MEGLSRRDQIYQQLGAVSELLRNPQTALAGGRGGAGGGDGERASNNNDDGDLHTGQRRADSMASGGGSSSTSIPMSLDRLTNNFLMALQNNPRNGIEQTNPYLPAGPIASVGGNGSSSSGSGYGQTADEQSEQHAQSSHNYPRTPSIMSGLGSNAPSRRNSFGSGGVSGSGEPLPGYARNPHPESHHVTYRHTLTSPSKKVTIVLDSVGSKSHPVYIQGVCTRVAGKIILALQGDENVSELRLRVKGTVTTAVNRAHSTSHRSVAEEIEFWYASKLLWQPTGQVPTLDAAAPSLVFPFEVDIPPKVPPTGGIRQPFPMPPSFVLGRSKTHEVGGIDAAAVRYYVKVTLARKGLLRPNERLFAPIVYYPRRQNLLFMPDARRQALLLGTPLPSPAQAPDGWAGKAEERVMRRGFFGTKKVPYKIAVLLPSPLTYARAEDVPYFVKVSSADPSMLGRIGPSSVQVTLSQKTIITAQGSAGVQETLVDRGVNEVVLESGTQRGQDDARRFTGKLSLQKCNANSFYCPNMEVMYQITCQLVESGQVQETMITIPITVVSIPPLAGVHSIAQQQLSTPATHIEGSALVGGVGPPAPQTIAPTTQQRAARSEEDDLPPSYFQVVERGNTRE